MQKKLKKVLTGINWFDRITIAPDKKAHDMERYRSGHNEAVLKTVCPQGHMGSNPILSAWRERQWERIRKNSFSNV